MIARDLPHEVFDHLQRLLITAAHPLLLHFDRGMRLVDIGGDLTFWGLIDAAPKLMTDIVRDLLIGIDTSVVQHMPMLELANGHVAHLHLIPQEPGFAVVLLDASGDAARKRNCQQEANDAELDALAKARLIARLRAGLALDPAALKLPPGMPAELVARLRALLAEAEAAGEPEPNAMSLASLRLDGRISSRIVLMKALDERGIAFYTNLDSDKGRQLLAHPRAALCFHWKQLRDGVQVRVEGRVERVDDAEADAYFATRPRESQLGAWASLQSQTLPDRATFDARFRDCEQRYAGAAVPRPPHWSGLRVVPDLVEFWFGAAFRLHERQRHEWRDGQWRQRLLFP